MKVTTIFFQAQCLGEFRLDFTQSGGMDLHGSFSWKMKLFPVLAIMGKLTKNALSRLFIWNDSLRVWCFRTSTKSDIDLYYYFRSGHVTAQMRHLGEFRLDFAQNEGMDPWDLLAKNKLFPVWEIGGKQAKNAISWPFMNRFTSGSLFWNQHDVLHRFLLLHLVGSRDQIRLYDASSIIYRCIYIEFK